MHRETEVKQYRAVFSGSRRAAWKKHISHFPTLWYNWNQHRTKTLKAPLWFSHQLELRQRSDSQLPRMTTQKALICFPPCWSRACWESEAHQLAHKEALSSVQPTWATSDLGYFLLTSKAAQSNNSHFK